MGMVPFQELCLGLCMRGNLPYLQFAAFPILENHLIMYVRVCFWVLDSVLGLYTNITILITVVL